MGEGLMKSGGHQGTGQYKVRMLMTSKPVLIAISAEQADRLYWLGRYVERVFSTVRIFNQSLDRMIDQDGEDYVAFCKRLSIPSDIYRDAADFEVKYLFDATNPDSIYSNLSRAYDNALVLRNFITTETMAFIQLALDRLEQGNIAESAFLETQRVSDLLLAFWGSVDDRVVDVERRDLLKVGKYSERLDLMIRLNCQEYAVDELLIRMLSHTRRVEPLLNREVLLQLRSMKEPALESNRAHLLHLINALH